VVLHGARCDPPIPCRTRRRISAMNNENSPTGETAGKAKKKLGDRVLPFDCK